MSSRAVDRIRTASVVAAFFACAAACSGRAPKNDTTGPPLECTEYEAALDRCYHRRTQFASQAAVLPRDDEARVRIKRMCVESMRQLKAVCGPVAAPPNGGL